MTRIGSKRGWYMRDYDTEAEYFISRWKWFARLVVYTYRRRYPMGLNTLVFLERADD